MIKVRRSNGIYLAVFAALGLLNAWNANTGATDSTPIQIPVEIAVPVK